MIELQTYHCMTPKQLTWLMCSVSVTPANELSLQELNQLIGIKLLTSGLLENFGPCSQFPGGRCPFCHTPPDAHAHRD